MAINALEVNSNMQETGKNEIMKNTLIVEYGRIVKVLDLNHVVVKQAVQKGVQEYFYTVTLMSQSSANASLTVEPSVGDSVALLFVRTYNALMFYEDVIDGSASGYNYFSGLGFLCDINGKSGNVSVYVSSDAVEASSTVRVSAAFAEKVAVGFSGESLSVMTESQCDVKNTFLGPITETHGTDIDESVEDSDGSKKVVYGKKSNFDGEFKGEVKVDFQGKVGSSFADKHTIDNNGATVIKASKGTGNITVKGTSIPTGKGVFCGIQYCPFSGLPQCAEKVALQAGE